MNTLSRLFITGFVILGLSSCATSLSDYKDSSPEFVLEEFFSGKLVAYGTFEDFSGKVVRRFKVDMIGTWEGNKGILDEDFYYADGETQKRIWTIIKKGEGEYTGTADDIVGEAKGRVEGFALNWSYTMALPVDGEVYNLNFDDWMYMVDENNVINKASVTKLGFEVGQVTLFIQRLGD